MTEEEKIREQQNRLASQQQELLKKLRAIGSDFWGGDPKAEESAPKQQAPEVRKTKKPEIGIENLWMTADETIDWTDALAHDAPTDGLTSPGLWRFYHEQAEKVLQGDTEAYAKVLRRTNPLGELTVFADGLTMRAPSADRLESSFTCRDSEYSQYGKKYLAAMGLRIARDLFACLPVTEVGVTGYNEGSPVLQVTYTRQALRHNTFRFLDPVRLTEQCGGIMA